MSFSLNNMNPAMRHAVNLYAHPDTYPAETSARHRDGIRLTALQEATHAFLGEAEKDPALRQNPAIAAMIDSNKRIEEMSRQGASQHEDEIRSQRERFLEAARELGEQARDKDSKPGQAFRNFISTHQLATGRVQDSYQSAEASMAGTVPPLSKKEREEVDALINHMKDKPALAALHSQAIKLSIDMMDSKNGGWDPKYGFKEYKGFDQLTAEEKGRTGQLALENGAKWREVLEEARKTNDGKVPEIIQREYDREAKLATNMGFGKEFGTADKAGELQTYVDGNKVRSTSATLDTSQALVAAINNGDPQHGLSNGPGGKDATIRR